MLADMVTVDGSDVPEPVAHLARDPLDPRFDRDAVVTVLRRKHSEIKRQLLDQTVVSGIGNIYADEALWRAKVNGARVASSMSRKQLAEVLDAAAEVMAEALGQGGTSFDSLYVNVNGESGYFERSLDAYGREGEPCRRCGAVMRREKFMNRSSFYCPKCQPRPSVHAACTRRDRRNGVSLLALFRPNVGLGGKMGGHDGTVGRAHRRAPLHRAQLTRRAGARRVRGRRGRLHPGRADEDRAGGLQRDEQRPADCAAASATTTRPRSGCPGAADREQERYPLLEENLSSTCRGCPRTR